MSESRKIIPITQQPALAEADPELHGCAELEPYALRVVGDSMAPEFLDGHIIILDPGLSAMHGAYVVAQIANETIFRQFWNENGRTFLKPLNDTYPMIELGENCQVLGVVVQRAGRRRADRKYY